MNDKKVKAAVKVVTGAVQVASGAATATGKGIVGGYLRSREMMTSARAIGRMSIANGQRNISQGMQEWRDASE
jgi:hypothetical protein